MRAALGLLVVLAACGSDVPAGHSLPDVEISPLSGGESVSLADVEGPAVINLWATWCGPCRREIPDFEAVHQERADEIMFVGINIGEDPQRVKRFMHDLGATYDQYLDPGGSVSTALKVTAMPTTFVIDADGAVTTRNPGPMSQADLNAAIDEALTAAS